MSTGAKEFDELKDHDLVLGAGLKMNMVGHLSLDGLV